MLRGEIRLVNLDPVLGAEANKRRPAVIVSNDGANATAGRLGPRHNRHPGHVECHPGVPLPSQTLS